MKQRLFSLVLCVSALLLSAGAAHAQAWLVAPHTDYIGTWADNQYFKHNLEWVRKNQKCGPAGVNAAGYCIWDSTSPPPAIDCKVWDTTCAAYCKMYPQFPQFCVGKSGQRVRAAPRANARAQASTAMPASANAAVLYTGQDFATNQGIYQLVAPLPAQNQPEVAKMFATLILNFNKTVPGAYGIPAHNLATAYAAALAGSYAAYTNRPFPENAVKPLFEQLERTMLNNPQILQTNVEQKNALYQVWVGMGMYLLGWQANLAKHPDPQQQAKMQKAGANALRAALGGTDPSRVSFTASGMQLH